MVDNQRFVCFGINATVDKLLSDMGIPEVLDLIVSPSWKMGSNLGPPEIMNIEI